MVFLDYVFTKQFVEHLCNRRDLLSYNELENIFMPARLHMDGAEVFGVREGYHRGNRDRTGLPSHEWNEVAVLFLAMYCKRIISDLERDEQCDFVLYDTAFDMKVRGLWVTARYDLAGSDEGHALYTEFKQALVSYSHRVRRDFVSACPRLRDHTIYGQWFRDYD